MSRSHGDRADGSDKIRNLKKQVESLKREVARLQKELRQSRAREPSEPGPSEDRIEPQRRKKGEGSICTECGKGVMVAWSIPSRAGEKTYLRCNLCGHNKPCK